ncbi:signal recognition particle protein, partial [Levilactobacillus brevis]|nr:signal recognition particle protein [Levilactobacillus brevis]
QVDPKDMNHLKAVVYSMTPAERTNPDLLNPSRRRRIAAGAGRPIHEVNRMIKQFNQMKKMMNQMSKGNMSGIEQLMGNTGMGGGGIGGRMQKMALNRMSRQMKKNKKKRLKRKKRK